MFETLKPKETNNESFDLESLKRETKVFTFSAATEGGQRADRKATGVRLRHLPTGIEVRVAETRSQARNKEIAFAILRKKVEKIK